MSEEKVKVLRCPYCNAPLKPYQNQCSYCGSYIIYEDEDIIAVPPEETQENEYVEQDEKCEKGSLLIDFIACILSIGLLATPFVYLIFNYKKIFSGIFYNDLFNLLVCLLILSIFLKILFPKD